jgi:hypothetical protein
LDGKSHYRTTIMFIHKWLQLIFRLGFQKRLLVCLFFLSHKKNALLHSSPSNSKAEQKWWIVKIRIQHWPDCDWLSTCVLYVLKLLAFKSEFPDIKNKKF